MARIPADRRKRDLWRRAQLAPVRVRPMPDCACGHRWAEHEPRDGNERGYCLDPNCLCLTYRPGGDRADG